MLVNKAEDSRNTNARLENERGATYVFLILASSFFLIVIVIGWMAYLPTTFAASTRLDLAQRVAVTQALREAPFYQTIADAAYLAAISEYDGQTYNLSSDLAADPDTRIWIPRLGANFFERVGSMPQAAGTYGNEVLALQGVFGLENGAGNNIDRYRDSVVVMTKVEPWAFIPFLSNPIVNSAWNLTVAQYPAVQFGFVMDTSFPLWRENYYRVFGGDPLAQPGNVAFENPGCLSANECFMWPLRHLVPESEPMSGAPMTNKSWSFPNGGVFQTRYPDGTAHALGNALKFFYYPYYESAPWQLYKEAASNFVDQASRLSATTWWFNAWIAGFDPDRTYALPVPDTLIPIHPVSEVTIPATLAAPFSSNYDLRRTYTSQFRGWISTANTSPGVIYTAGPCINSYTRNLSMELAGGRPMFDSAATGPLHSTDFFVDPNESPTFQNNTLAKRRRNAGGGAPRWFTDDNIDNCAANTSAGRSFNGDNLRSLISQLGMGTWAPYGTNPPTVFNILPQPISFPWAECVAGDPLSNACTDKICEALDINGTGDVSDCVRNGVSCQGADCDLTRLDLWPRERNMVESLIDAALDLEAQRVAGMANPLSTRLPVNVNSGQQHLVVQAMGMWSPWSVIPWGAAGGGKDHVDIADDLEEAIAQIICQTPQMNITFVFVPFSQYDRQTIAWSIQRIQAFQDLYNFVAHGSGAAPVPTPGLTNSGLCDAAAAGGRMGEVKVLLYDWTNSAETTERLQMADIAAQSRDFGQKIFAELPVLITQ